MEEERDITTNEISSYIAGRSAKEKKKVHWRPVIKTSV